MIKEKIKQIRHRGIHPSILNKLEYILKTQQTTKRAIIEQIWPGELELVTPRALDRRLEVYLSILRSRGLNFVIIRPTIRHFELGPFQHLQPNLNNKESEVLEFIIKNDPVTKQDVRDMFWKGFNGSLPNFLAKYRKLGITLYYQRKSTKLSLSPFEKKVKIVKIHKKRDPEPTTITLPCGLEIENNIVTKAFMDHISPGHYERIRKARLKKAKNKQKRHIMSSPNTRSINFELSIN